MCLSIFRNESDAKYNITYKYENLKLKPTGHSLYEVSSFDNLCTEGSGYIYACENCDYTEKYIDTPPTGHSPIESSVEIPATCTKSGMKSGTICEYCNKVLSVGEIIPPKGHTPVLKNKKAATCSEEGYTGDEVCSTCGETISKGTVIPKLDHQYITVKGYSSTCTIVGLSDYEVCKFCGHKKSETTVLPILNSHNFETISATKATCNSAGNVEYQRCKDCGKILIDGKEASYISTIIPKTPHKTVVKNKKAATTTEKGYTGDEYCTLCNKIINKGIVINILPSEDLNIQDDLVIDIPKCSFKGGKKKLSVSYTNVTGAAGFQVKYTFNGKNKIKNFDTLKSTKKTIKGLKKGKYKIQVRAFSDGKKIFSAWTKIKTIKVK